MAYLIDPLEEKKKQDAAQGMGTSGVVGSNVSAPGSQGNVAADTKAPTSSGFVNLQSYLDANKGSGEGMAQNMTKKVAADADSYSGQAADAAAKAEQAMKDSVKDAAGNAQSIGGGIAGAKQNYGDAANFLNSGYGGPSAGDYTTDLKAGKDALTGKLDKVDDNATQQTMLRDTYGQNGNYSSGFGALDTFLIGNDSNAQKRIGEVKSKTADVAKSFDDSSGKIAQSEAAAKGILDTAKNELKGTISKRKGSIEDTGLKRMLDKNTTNTNYKGFQAASLGDGLYDSDLMELEALSGLIGEEYNPSKYGRTWNAGEAPPPPPPQAVAAAAAAAPAARAASSSAPSIIDQANKQGAGAINSIVKAPENTANAAKKPSAPIIQLPTLKTASKAADSVARSIGNMFGGGGSGKSKPETPEQKAARERQNALDRFFSKH